jgi:hypothetical protein
LTICDSNVSRPTLSAHHETAGLVERAGDDLAADLFGHGHGFAGHEGFVERRPSLEYDAIDRDLLAGTHAQMIADHETVDLDLVVGAVVADAAGGFWRELEQGLDRSRRCVARAQLQHLTEQHQHRDDGGGLEINRNGAAMALEGGGEDLRRNGTDHAVGVGDASAHRDQREHVEVAGAQRLPAANEERPARPQHDRRCDGKLDPVRPGRIDQAVSADEMSAHFEDHRGRGEHRADPETPRHVGKLGIWRIVEACDLGLQRHAADRAAAGADLANLRVHRAGVDRAGRRFRRRLFRLEIFGRIGGEFGAAACRAEMEGLAVMVEAVFGGRRVDDHAADGIPNARSACA